MAKLNKIAVLGAGNMGTAIAQLIAGNGYRVGLWDYNPNTVKSIKKYRENKDFLPEVKLSSRIGSTSNMADAVDKSDFIVIAVASPYVRDVSRQLGILIGKKNVVVAHVVKGLESSSGSAMHEVIQEEMPKHLKNSVVTISGPSIAKELVAGIPTAVVAAGEKLPREKVRKVFSSATFKVSLSSDIKGVSLCGALKNPYAILLGMCDGMGLQMNTKSFVFNQAINEMALVISKLGGQKETVYGLAGLGDMLVTGFGDSRNRAFGEMLCAIKNKSNKHKIKTKQVCEGVENAKSFYLILKKKKINAGLLNLVYSILYKDIEPCKALINYLSKEKI